MWSTHKRRSGSRLGHDKRGIPAFDTASLLSNLGSPRRNYLSIIATDINVLHFGFMASKRLLKTRHWWLKNKERKVHFRFVERRFLAAINLTGSAEGALVPVLLRITHWTKSGLPVSPPGLFPPWFQLLAIPWADGRSKCFFSLFVWLLEGLVQTACKKKMLCQVSKLFSGGEGHIFGATVRGRENSVLNDRKSQIPREKALKYGVVEMEFSSNR